MTPILHEGATVVCPHAPGTTQAVASSTRVRVDGSAAVTITHAWTVTGCSFTPTAGRCSVGSFTSGASRVRVEGQPVATTQSDSKCSVRATDKLTAQITQPRVMVDWP